jgi:hypothetical protein
VPTIQDDDLRIDGGHGADAPLPALRFEKFRTLDLADAPEIKQRGFI